MFQTTTDGIQTFCSNKSSLSFYLELNQITAILWLKMSDCCCLLYTISLLSSLPPKYLFIASSTVGWAQILNYLLMLWTCLSEGSCLSSGVNAGFRTAWLTLKPLCLPVWKEWVRFLLMHPVGVNTEMLFPQLLSLEMGNLGDECESAEQSV